MQERIRNFINKISIKTYKRIVVILILICIYLVANVIYTTVEYRKLWLEWQLSGNETVDSTNQSRNDTTDYNFKNDTLFLSLCDIGIIF